MILPSSTAVYEALTPLLELADVDLSVTLESALFVTVHEVLKTDSTHVLPNPEWKSMVPEMTVPVASLVPLIVDTGQLTRTPLLSSEELVAVPVNTVLTGVTAALAGAAAIARTLIAAAASSSPRVVALLI